MKRQVCREQFKPTRADAKNLFAPVPSNAPSATAGRYGSQHSSKTVEWATPQDFFDKLDLEFHFTVDLCATPKNAKCAAFFSRADNVPMEKSAYGTLQPLSIQAETDLALAGGVAALTLRPGP
jgi:DNA N-6-adenine-methyltransferase (Dam)